MILAPGRKGALLRHCLQRSVRDVAAEAGLDPVLLRCVERGETAPGPAILRALARALRCDVDFLQSPEPPRIISAFRRWRMDRGVKDGLARVEQVCRNQRLLEKLTGRRRPQVPVVRGSSENRLRDFDHAVREASRLARAERRRLRLGDGPLGDVFAVLEKAGAPVLRLPLSPRFVAGALYDPAYGGFILVDSQLTPDWQAFAAAHEYCHLLRDRMKGVRYDAWIKVQLPKTGASARVTFANAFAAAFLGPAALPGRRIRRSGAKLILPEGHVALARGAFRAGKLSRTRLREILHP